jgi:hypothetical protein
MRGDSSAGGGRAVQAIDLISGCLITQTSDSGVAYSPLVKDARAERPSGLGDEEGGTLST